MIKAPLLELRGGAEDVAGLQVLRGVAAFEAAMQTMAPTQRRDRLVGVAGPAEGDEQQAGAMSVAIVIPETGFDDVPMMPTMRDETVTKKKPKTITSSPSGAWRRCRRRAAAAAGR